MLHNFRTTSLKAPLRAPSKQSYLFVFCFAVKQDKVFKRLPWISILLLFFTKILLIFQILIGNQNYKKHISFFLFDMVVLLFALCLFWRRIRQSWLILAKLSANFFFFFWICYLSLEHWNLLFWPWFSE